MGCWGGLLSHRVVYGLCGGSGGSVGAIFCPAGLCTVCVWARVGVCGAFFFRVDVPAVWCGVWGGSVWGVLLSSRCPSRAVWGLGWVR